jgi:hypothetical protein
MDFIMNYRDVSGKHSYFYDPIFNIHALFIHRGFILYLCNNKLTTEIQSRVKGFSAKKAPKQAKSPDERVSLEFMMCNNEKVISDNAKHTALTAPF